MKPLRPPLNANCQVSRLDPSTPQFAQATQQMGREFAHYSAQAVARATTNPWLAGLGVILLILAGGLAFALMRVLHVRQ